MTFRRLRSWPPTAAMIALLLAMTLLLGLPMSHAASYPTPNGVNILQSVDGQGHPRGAAHAHCPCRNEQVRSSLLKVNVPHKEPVLAVWQRTDTSSLKGTVPHPLDRPPIDS